MLVNDVVEAVREAEAAGFESAWVAESSLMPGRDAISYLGALAVSTERIRLATGIINVFSRSATLIASTLATLDEMSSGRMILGIGTGHAVMGDYHSVPFKEPVSRLREYVSVIRKLVAGEQVNFEGEYVAVRGLKLNVRPSREGIPVYVATVSERLAEAAGEFADGVLFFLMNPARVRELSESVARGAKSVGRSADDVDVACYLPVFAMSDPNESIQLARQTVASYARSIFYRRLFRRMGFRKETAAVKEAWDRGGVAASEVPEHMAKDLVIVGSPDQCRKRLEDYLAAGVRLPIIQPYCRAGDLDSNVRPTVEAFSS